jgi:hypothetical protein
LVAAALLQQLAPALQQASPVSQHEETLALTITVLVRQQGEPGKQQGEPS